MVSSLLALLKRTNRSDRMNEESPSAPSSSSSSSSLLGSKSGRKESRGRQTAASQAASVGANRQSTAQAARATAHHTLAVASATGPAPVGDFYGGVAQTSYYAGSGLIAADNSLTNIPPSYIDGVDAAPAGNGLMNYTAPMIGLLDPNNSNTNNSGIVGTSRTPSIPYGRPPGVSPLAAFSERSAAAAGVPVVVSTGNNHHFVVLTCSMFCTCLHALGVK
jgi:hypothetical protein